ncbi:hypothetical protein P152DRAFT_508771 [Eremomyces bilateralis CBS 781.70]|uniref:Glycoside hydrolase family 125 protein n=1 Tax=Eremomyces bilateralis CBS 781.70 TaxID=1392243 RepID=A0A6G1FXK8_9PEZI|nr:uncharacterized protein P152DRAFT_508771 [Eremomyces bilateralis CBS 781.70]KAF1810488.1 hypothetical protein P152DRAFT_508771 [Eremomyces bilateralis CBS 781.70]
MRPISASLLLLASASTCLSTAQSLEDQTSSGGFDLGFTLACPDYKQYSANPHPPFSTGPLQLPFQRPSTRCRTFQSTAVDEVIGSMVEKMVDKDLARIFENAFPNTLDTTIRWHDNGAQPRPKERSTRQEHEWEGPQSFVVTGDINAEWLRDSTNQLSQYQRLAKLDKALESLILGAINTQAEYVIKSPYCNAFQPPPPSRLPPTGSGQADTVHPMYEPSFVFECKYELDSLAAFLSLANQFHATTGSTAFLTPRWYTALNTVMRVIDEQSRSTFHPVTGAYVQNEYRFQRMANTGTETLNLAGIGNPLGADTGLVRSAFRPSDDATIFGFFIPGNAMMAVELKRTADLLAAAGKSTLASTVRGKGESIERSVWEHGTVQHEKWGKVFAFEVDGYGSHLLMDDANLPSLLALPLLGFVSRDDETYRNTRKMILSAQGNPYYLIGEEFHGIGGPHIGVRNAWPMSLLVQAMTSDDDEEIMGAVGLVKNASLLGLIHESVNVENKRQYTRSWFAWANSVFAQTVLDLAERKPHLLFGPESKPWSIGQGMVRVN